MTTSRYSGPRRSPPELRMLKVDLAPLDETPTTPTAPEYGSLPRGTTSRYFGPRRELPQLRMLSLFPPAIPAESEQSDPLPIIL